MGTTQSRSTQQNANSATALYRRASRLKTDDDFGRAFSGLVNRSGGSVHAFLKEIVNTTSGLPRFKNEEFPLLLPHDDKLGVAGSTIGTAFGWLLRIRNEAQLETVEAEQGAFAFEYQLGVEHAHDGFAAIHRRAADIASGEREPQISELERIAIVLAWFEESFRGGMGARIHSPLAMPGFNIGDADEMLQLVPRTAADHLSALGELAEEKLQPFLENSSPVQFGVSLGWEFLPADADLIAGETLLELKCIQGERRASGREFKLTPPLLRQLLGYLLLDESDFHGCTSVGVYAARYGVLWTIEAEELIAVTGAIEPDLMKLRKAFQKVLP